MSLFHLIAEIRDRQRKEQPFESRIIGSELPSWPPCPPYRQRLKGLVNSQSTCYFLSCVQTLFSVPAFTAILDHLAAGLHSFFSDVGSLRRIWSEELASATPILRLFILLLDDIAPHRPNETKGGDRILPTDFGYVSTGKPLKLDPKFFELLTFEPGYQQDASDCMSRIVTQLHEEMAGLLRKFSKSPDPSPVNPWEAQEEEDDEGWTTIGTQGQKLVVAREVNSSFIWQSPVSLFCL